MHTEIVSHCWNYSRLLTYQLSSLVLYPPSETSVTMTVFYNEEDRRTCEVLKYFAGLKVPRVQWHWWRLDQPQLFRRAIGRNMAALASEADWIWFTDCDQVFHRGCLDTLARRLPSCRGPLAYPRCVGCTDHLDSDNPVFKKVDAGPAVVDIDPGDFRPVPQPRAIGALQITRGELVRRIGYCKDIPQFMRPAKQFGRTFEDVKFRKLLGTKGEPMDIPGVYRIEHQPKGRRWFRPAKNL